MYRRSLRSVSFTTQMGDGKGMIHGYLAAAVSLSCTAFSSKPI